MTVEYNELIRQEYGNNNCVFSAGEVKGHPIDNVYLKLEKNGVEPTIMLFTVDELAAIAWCCTGTIWSMLIDKRPVINQSIVEKIEKLMSDRLQYNQDNETLDEVVMTNAHIHLEKLNERVFMLIVENDKYHWHLRVGTKGRGKVDAWVLESEDKGECHDA